MSGEVALVRTFEERWREAPRIFQAPGRVNLIGEFTDYNDGFVMPAALALSTWVAAGKRSDRRLAVYSENFGEGREFELDDPAAAAAGHWSDYVYGVAVVLQRAGFRLSGANLLIRGEVPIGAGLSSSAAIEVATARALLGVSGITAAPVEIARLCQQAENEFVGVQCGIMDQFAACHAAPGEALMLDCRSLEFRRAALPAEACLIVCNSMVKRELARSGYNLRRAECRAGVHHFPHAAALRDVTLAQLEQARADMDETVYRRCRHVVGENGRVEQAFEALERGELDRFGELMLASHASLRDDFEVSCRELDLLVDLASGRPEVYGCRMTGGGFGGCTVNLVQEKHADAFCDAIHAGYRNAMEIELSIYRV